MTLATKPSAVKLIIVPSTVAQMTEGCYLTLTIFDTIRLSAGDLAGFHSRVSGQPCNSNFKVKIMNNLLVAMLGKSNAGKSSVWDNLFDGKVRTGKHTRNLYLNEDEYVEVFLIYGSPQERWELIENILPEENPRIVLCSIQYVDQIENPGLPEDTKKTFTHFIENEYFLFAHWLNPGWEETIPYFDNIGLMNWLLAKQSMVGIRNVSAGNDEVVSEIKDFIYGWAKSRRLIISDNT